MTARTLLLALVVLAGSANLAGCATGRMSFDETTGLFHDDLRWGRLPAAGGAVDASMRAAFATHHSTWGSVVHVMDVEVEGISAASSHGTVRLRVVWVHGDDSTTVRESLVEEQWETLAGAWKLRNESVISGDPGLFGTPSAPAGATPGATPGAHSAT